MILPRIHGGVSPSMAEVVFSSVESVVVLFFVSVSVSVSCFVFFFGSSSAFFSSASPLGTISWGIAVCASAGWGRIVSCSSSFFVSAAVIIAVTTRWPTKGDPWVW